MTKVINLEVEAGRAEIHTTEGGGIMINGKAGVNLLRLTMIKSGMEFESNTGMKLTGKAPSCFTIARKEYGFKGSKKAIYEAFCAHFGFEAKELGDKTKLGTK
jgi:squalene cyclase